VSVINLSTTTIAATIKVGHVPGAVAVDAGIATAYVAESSNAVAIINLKANKVTSAVKVGDSPAAIAVDSRTHVAYVSNSASNSVSVIAPAAHSPTT
jgi:serine/threonine protein kinase, bacterial